MAELMEGQKAPQFELPRDGGGTLKLADFAGKPVVLYFYPQDDTETCTAEAIAFSALKGIRAVNRVTMYFALQGADQHWVVPFTRRSHTFLVRGCRWQTRRHSADIRESYAQSSCGVADRHASVGVVRS